MLGTSNVHGVADPLKYLVIVVGRVTVLGIAATSITFTPQSLYAKA